jgi:hypothetical protein
LEDGHQILLLRKGGIHEEEEFRIQHERFLLYPTYEHQDAHQLQPRWHDLLSQTEAEAPAPDRLRITGYAEVTEVFHLKDEPAVLALKDFYVWNEHYVWLRFHYQPDRALYGVLVRAHRLPEPVELNYRKEYGGCRSWIELDREISVDHAIPALTDEEYQERVSRLREPLLAAS